MKNKEVKLKTELTRDEIVELLGLYHVIDEIVSDFGEMFDTDLGKIRSKPNHWRPYVMPDDDRAWFHTPKED